MNPKLNVIRTTGRKLAPTFRRYFGEVGRTLVNPSAAEVIATEAVTSLHQLLVAELGKGGQPVVTSADAVPATAHWLIEPLSRRANFAHGRLPVSVAMAFVEEDGTCQVGAIYFPIEDVLVQAELGSGASGTERFRASNRAELHDAMLCLPWKTADVVSLGLLEKCEAVASPTQAPLHTRKTGDTFFDIIDVASGRADVAIATRLTRLEALLARLVLHESGATGTDLQGNPLTAKSETLLAASFKLHPEALKVFKTA